MSFLLFLVLSVCVAQQTARFGDWTQRDHSGDAAMGMDAAWRNGMGVEGALSKPKSFILVEGRRGTGLGGFFLLHNKYTFVAVPEAQRRQLQFRADNAPGRGSLPSSSSSSNAAPPPDPAKMQAGAASDAAYISMESKRLHDAARTGTNFVFRQFATISFKFLE
jgi:hypothetical protein